MFLARSQVFRLFGDLYFNLMQVCMLFTMDGWMDVCGCKCMHIGNEWQKPMQNEYIGTSCLKEGSRSLHDR